MVEEIWKPIKGYEGLYEISNWGRVKSLNYRKSGKAELMIPVDNGNGYLFVNLWKNGEYEQILIHRLVATHFIENPENKPEVNHKDENKENNSVENLEWIWHKDNINHGTRNKRAGVKLKEILKNGKLSKKVLQFTLDGVLIREWPSTMECGRNGYNFSHIAACCRGERKSAYGFKWCYA